LILDILTEVRQCCLLSSFAYTVQYQVVAQKLEGGGGLCANQGDE
jgi:hypothetical protein